MTPVRYNERAWAVDLTSEANAIVRGASGVIGSFGGEWGLPGGSSSLFPDVLVFGQQGFGAVLQGWELKMPETPIDDPDLRGNALEKANRLGANSFLLWNVREATLWVREDHDNFRMERHWTDLADITTRDQVLSARARWTRLLREIVTTVEELLANGTIRPTFLIDTLGEDGLVAALFTLAPRVAAFLRTAAADDGPLNDEILKWWHWVKAEYPEGEDRWDALARIVLASWLNKLMFAHVLQSKYGVARRVDGITTATPVKDAVEILASISAECDFRNVLTSQLGEETLPADVWAEIGSLNVFLSRFRYDSVDAGYLHSLLQTVVQASKRKAAGQYATPTPLASLLARLALPNLTSTILDPCCGTGTIARAALNAKVEAQVDIPDALQQVWLSDKFSYPLQVAHMAMVETEAMGAMIHIFREDIADVAPLMSVELVNPADGGVVRETLPLFECVASNLPFVRQKDIARLNPRVLAVNDLVASATGGQCLLAGRSDLYAYLPFHIWRLVADGGRVALILSNSWLGVEWGAPFREALLRFYEVSDVLVSGAGRWFQNAQVVTTIVVLKKKPRSVVELPAPTGSSQTRFWTTLKPMDELAKGDELEELSALIRRGDVGGQSWLRMNQYTTAELDALSGMGLTWAANFADVRWLLEISGKLVKASTVFAIERGMRRGWNEMFYPSPGHGIEPEFIKPVLKSMERVATPVASPDRVAFCCPLDEAELRRRGCRGALAWIERFRHGTNDSGEPLIESLARSAPAGMEWYQMSDSTLADLVTTVNPDKRLFFAKMQARGFVDQRLVRLTVVSPDTDVDLCLALLNTALGAFYLEGLGFGRGLGALDLSPTRLKRGLRILDPLLISPSDAARVKKLYEPLLHRNVRPILEELDMPDRRDFELAVMEAYGLAEYYPRVIEALRALHAIRFAVNA